RSSADGYKQPREHARWTKWVAGRWPLVRIEECQIGEESLLTGHPVPVRALVEMADLAPTDLQVEAVVGRVGAEGTLTDTQVLSLAPLEQRGTRFLFGRD